MCYNNEIRNNPALLGLRDEIVLVQSRILDQLEKLGTGTSDEAWIDVLAARAAMERAKEALIRKDNDTASKEMRSAMKALDRACDTDKNELDVWKAVNDAIDRKKRLVESERHLLYEMKQMVTIEQLLLFMSAWTTAVSKHITDPQVRGAIQVEFDKLARRSDPTALDSVPLSE